ncbi:MAG: hypothetical protein PF448_05190 [Bacteroidales bacterium]|jgi:hypothetical protein|nr:hypothetical protein [Bacteroidales bacterium]
MGVKKIKILIAVFIAIFFLQSCNQETKYVEKTVKESYKISVPENMTELEGLSSEASFQYGNDSVSFYVLVIDETSDEFYAVFDEYELDEFYPRNLMGYSKMVVETMQENADIFNVGAFENLTINGIEAVQTHFYGIYNGLDIYYHLTTIESDSHFYQIMSWTPKGNMKLHKESMIKIAQSFKEI